MSSTGTEGRIRIGDLKGFNRVDENNLMVTEEFLESARELVQAFESFGMLLSPITNDMGGNIEKIDQCYKVNPTEYHHMTDFVRLRTILNKRFAPDSLVWLNRGLELIELFLINVLYDSEAGDNLSGHIKKAYEIVLAQHHNFLIRQTVSLMYRMLPSRSTIMGTGDKQKENMKHLEAYLPNLSATVKQIKTICIANNIPL